MEKGPLRVGVLGAAGRMGQSVCSAIMDAESMELAITVDLVPEEKAIGGIPLAKDIEAFFEAKVDAVVDFTVAEASVNNLPLLAEKGIDVVVGTSGSVSYTHLTLPTILLV